MISLIRQLSSRHFLIHLITVVVLLGGVVAWNSTSKEELPDITFNVVRVSTSYSGASAEDVEFYVTEPIEESLMGLDGVYRITSTSSPGSSQVSIELARGVTDIDRMITEIQNQVSSVRLPQEILDDPVVRVFETSKKAIIDMAIYFKDKPLLSVADRVALQDLVRGLETRLVALPEIFELRRSGYLQEEMIVNVDPKRLIQFDIPLNSVAQEIQRSHVRAPAGTLKSGAFEQVTVLSELDSKAKLDKLVVQGGFDSKAVKLKSLATITDGFEEQRSIYKVNGREAILLNVVKNSRYGILDALAEVKKEVGRFQDQVLVDTGVELVFLDDESIDVRNRLSIIATNGLMGFLLILATLFIFLNKRSGVWVALGIPFTLCFTLVAGKFLGYSINGVTLAAIIIVLGIVVDDAIIVAENISRRFNEGEPLHEAAVNGTAEMMAPVLASILTTCAAFLPLYFFSGRFGSFVSYIPAVIFLMLLASLLESFLLLPGHMMMFPSTPKPSSQRRFFERWEGVYERILTRLLPKRYWIMLVFATLIFGAGLLVKQSFSFVMFPDEESREIVLSGVVDQASSAKETAQYIQVIEDQLGRYVGAEGVGVRTEVARGRRGDSSSENQFRSTLELRPKEDRQKSSKQILDEIKSAVESVPGISQLRFRRQRFGQSSGSVFEIVVAENNDVKRDALVKELQVALEKHPSVVNVEPDVIPLQAEYVIDFNQDELKRLSVSPASISSTLRMVLNGQRLYTITRNDEDVNVILTVADHYRDRLDSALKVPVENNRNYLIPLHTIVTVTPIQAKKTIRRQDQKRSSFVYADLSPESTLGPLQVAEELEATVFPKLLAKYPTARLSFDGEVVDSRESKRDLLLGVSTAIALIYLILAVLFDSAIKPFRIMMIIPFGVIGVIFAFYAHQKLAFGFYAAIGTLGMLGVVVNDAIVMLSKLDRGATDKPMKEAKVASIAKTRLRAIFLTTLTTVAGVMPTAYGIGGYDAMLSDMMIALAWGLIFGTIITLILTPCVFMIERDFKQSWKNLGLFKGLTMLLVLGTVLGVSEPAMAKTRVVSLDDFIVGASQRDTVFHQLLFSRYYYQYDQDRNVDVADLAVSISSDFVVNSSEKQDARAISLTQTLPKWGQSAVASYSESSSGVETKSFTVSQQIARNAFGRSTRLDSKIQHLKTDISQHQLVEAYEDYMAELMSLYYTWIRQYESLQLAKAAYKENEKVLKSILSRQQKKIANDTDVNKLKLQTFAKQEQIIEFKKSYLETTFQIKRALGLDPAESIRPDTSITIDALPGSLPIAMQQIQATSRTYQVLAKLQQQVGLELDRAGHDLLPSMALSAGIVEQTERYGLVGLSLDIPVSNRSSKATYQVAKLVAEEQKIDNQSASDSLEVLLRSVHQGLEFQKNLIDISTQKRRVAQRILKAESENYSYGKITLNDYIDAVNRFDNARFQEIDRKITYQKLSIEWKRLSDQLVTKSVKDL